MGASVGFQICLVGIPGPMVFEKEIETLERASCTKFVSC